MRAAIFQATDDVSERGDAETDEYEPAEHEPGEHGSGDAGPDEHESAAHGSAEHESDEHESAEHESRADPSDDVVRCFQDHEDAVSIATLDDAYLTCDCCDIAWTKCRLEFYRCQKCGMELCAECGYVIIDKPAHSYSQPPPTSTARVALVPNDGAASGGTPPPCDSVPGGAAPATAPATA